MRTIRTKVYQFNELNENAKEVAIKKNSDINVNFNWWVQTYEDAENIGLKITSFDLDRNKGAEGEFILSANEVAQNIFNNHGDTCETYKTADDFMIKWQPVFNSYMETEEGEDDLMNIEDDFLNKLLENYADMLQNECDYLQSEEAISETLILNEYEFTKEGNRFYN